jgi:NhaA family Na+:H+ antiporter
MFKSGVHATVAGVLLGWTIPLGRLDHEDMLASPLLLLEHALKPWVSWVIMPVFALANAGVSLAGMNFGSLGSPVTAGVGLGLLLGKPIGIFLLSLLAVKIGVARLPRGANWSTMWGVGMLAGIGFTMALFVASLSFRGDAHLEDLSKVGILVASLLSGILGSIVLGRAVKHLPPPPEEQPVRANLDPNLPRVVRPDDAGVES